MTPVATYGTLREGGWNDRLWAGRAKATPGVIAGYRLVGSGRAFPYVVPDLAGTVVVDLLDWNTPADEAVLLARFDRLEGVPHHYRRTTVLALDAHGTERTAWLYVPADPEFYSELRPVPGGDWIDGEAAWGWSEDRRMA